MGQHRSLLILPYSKTDNGEDRTPITVTIVTVRDTVKHVPEVAIFAHQPDLPETHTNRTGYRAHRKYQRNPSTSSSSVYILCAGYPRNIG